MVTTFLQCLVTTKVTTMVTTRHKKSISGWPWRSRVPLYSRSFDAPRTFRTRRVGLILSSGAKLRIFFVTSKLFPKKILKTPKIVVPLPPRPNKCLVVAHYNYDVVRCALRGRGRCPCDPAPGNPGNCQIAMTYAKIMRSFPARQTGFGGT